MVLNSHLKTTLSIYNFDVSRYVFKYCPFLYNTFLQAKGKCSQLRNYSSQYLYILDDELTNITKFKNDATRYNYTHINNSSHFAI